MVVRNRLARNPDKKPLGFQITFFRSATGHDTANPSRFAPKQLAIAHAALSDPAVGKLLHDQKLHVAGSISRNGKPVTVGGSAWLDHECSTSALDADAAGWDGVGANLNDGSALMAFQIRSKSGGKLWAHAALRDRSGRITQFKPDEVRFTSDRAWRSPRTHAAYPAAATIQTGALRWQLTPLQDDQELDSRQSTGAVYWEGAAS